RRFGSQRRLGVILLILGAAVSLSLAIFPSTAAATGLQMVFSDSGVVVRVLTWGVAALLVVAGVVFWSPAIHSRVGRITVVLGNSSYSAYLASAMVIELSMRLLLKFVGGSVPFS